VACPTWEKAETSLPVEMTSLPVEMTSLSVVMTSSTVVMTSLLVVTTSSLVEMTSSMAVTSLGSQCLVVARFEFQLCPYSAIGIKVV
jgi:hypothetical protein